LALSQAHGDIDLLFDEAAMVSPLCITLDKVLEGL